MKRTFSRPDLSLASLNYATVWGPVIGPVPTTDDKHYKVISSHKGPNVHTIKTHLFTQRPHNRLGWLTSDPRLVCTLISSVYLTGFYLPSHVCMLMELYGNQITYY